jgi:hypothetical protein
VGCFHFHLNTPTITLDVSKKRAKGWGDLALASRSMLPPSRSQNDIIRLLHESLCYGENAPLWYQEFIKPRMHGQGTDRTDASAAATSNGSHPL